MPIQKETACKGTALKNIKYITNPEKTVDENGQVWIDTHNMLATGSERAAELHKEFREVNALWKKNKDYDERKYYHAVINFKGIDGVTPEMAMNVGRAYLEHFYPNNQAIMSVHCDNEGYHFHACINSVNMETGKKVNRTDKDLADRKDYVNEVAEKMYGIEPFNWRDSVEEKRAAEKTEKLTGKKDNYNYTEQQMHEGGRASELDVLREKILRTALTTKSREEFEERLKQDYDITMPRNTEKTVSFKYKEGSKGTIRGRTLGDYYTAEFIDKMLAYNRRQEQSRQEQPQEKQPVNFNDLKAIAQDKNYIVARNNGFNMSAEEFSRKSELELTCQFAIIKLSKTGVGVAQDGSIIINGQKVQTDERLQKMYDAGVAARQCSEKYGCQNMRDLEKKQTELEDKLKDVKNELRKERKIETSLKNKLNRKMALHEAVKTVYQGKGTHEEQNKAKSLLYRNGIKKDQFKDYQTIDKISREVIAAKRSLEEQQAKTKDIFFKQKALQKDIETIENAINGVELANSPRFYYGNNLDRHIGLEPQKQQPEQQKTAQEEVAKLSFQELLNKAYERAEEQNRGQEPNRSKGKDDNTLTH